MLRVYNGVINSVFTGQMARPGGLFGYNVVPAGDTP